MKTAKLLLASMIAATAIFAAPMGEKGMGGCDGKGQKRQMGGYMDKGMMFGAPMSIKTLKLTKEQEDKIAELNKINFSQVLQTALKEQLGLTKNK